jgi:hypothetical protein
LKSFFLLLFFSVASFSRTLGGDALVLRGTITDAVSGDPLPAAHVRIAGTSRGTITSPAGQYALHLEPGTYRIIVSMIGYAPDSADVALAAPATCNVRLHPSDIVLPELVVTAEDPAVEIIRRAIARKRHWVDKLASYQMDAFTRQVIHRDTAIASITESFSRGYWQHGDTLREVILQRRQTANVPGGFNFASVGRILNFNDDEVRFFGYSFVGPTAPDALDYYDVHLVRTHHDSKRDIFEIALKPRTRTTPLFQGTIHIADESYALVGVDVEPNEAFQIPFVKEKHLRYKQHFASYQDDIWLPIDIRIVADVTVGMVGISIPRFGFEQTSVITEYVVNPQLPDSIFRRARLTVDSSATRPDSTFWASHVVLPLTPEEKHAYASLDSTQSLDVQFRPGGVTLSVGGDGGVATPVLRYADVAFNRVEGLHLGVHFDGALAPTVDARAAIAYGFSCKATTYAFGGSLFTSAAHKLGVSIDGYRGVEPNPEAGFFGPLVNSVTSLFFKNDYCDYHVVEGWRTGISFAPRTNLSGSLVFTDELHTSVTASTDYSFFSRSRSYRLNGPIHDGTMRSVALSLRYGEPEMPLNVGTRNGLDVSFEYSSPRFAGSDFDFTRVEACATLFVPTAHSILFSPGFSVRIAGGVSGGMPPVQRAFTIESASSYIGPFGVMRALDVKEFAGTSYLACNIEHNFRSLPFLALGIPFLYERSIEFIVHGGAAQTWDTKGLSLPTTSGWYGEAGFGLNRLFDVFRADCTWRVTAPTGFRVTVSLGQIL